MKLERRAQGTITADADEGIEAESFKGLACFRENGFWNGCLVSLAHFGYEAAAIGCSKNCATHGHDAIDAVGVEFPVAHGRDHAFVAICESDHLPLALSGRTHHSTNHRVESRTVSAARENADFFNGLVFHQPILKQNQCQPVRFAESSCKGWLRVRASSR